MVCQRPKPLRRWRLLLPVWLVGLVQTPAAHAEFPSAATLVAAAEHWSTELASSQIAEDEALARVDRARAALLPALVVSAGYTRNQFESTAVIPDGTGAFERAVFTPYDQLELTGRVEVPLVHPVGWAEVRAARLEATASTASTAVSHAELHEAVVAAWYEVCWADASINEAERVLQNARDNAAVARSRSERGLATPLDVARADADVARAMQQVAESELSARLARRQLYALTGVEVNEPAPALEASLEPERPLEQWGTSVGTSVRVSATVAATDAAAGQRRVAALAWAPRVSAVVQERVANGAGFGEVASLSAGLQLTWTVDASPRPAADLAELTVERAALAEVDAQRAEQDALFELWHALEARRAIAESTRIAEASAELAAATARDRFAAGIGSQLEVSAAERDAAVAAMGRVTAEARWLQTRALLRLRAGMPVDEVTR